MTKQVRWTHGPVVIGGGLAVLAAAALMVSCGGGGGSSDDSAPPASGKAATIDTASATSAAKNMTTLVNICQKPAGGLSADESPLVQRALAGWQRQRLLRQGMAPDMKAQALTGTKPADMLGSCGGRVGYPSYSHTNGVTTATLSFQDYCTTDSASGNRQVISGNVAFVNTATPTASGPITSKWEGNSSGITVRALKSDGTVVSSQTLSFENMVNTIGVPGGSSTAEKPDVLVASELKLVDNVANKTYRQTNYRISSFDTASGGTQMSISGRGYRSNGDYFDLSTTTPVTMDNRGNYTGGVITFAGAGGSSAVVTIQPGADLQATLVVNGQPVTSVPTCTK